MESLPDIDTSELEAELDADIEDTLEKGRVRLTTFHDIGDETAAAEPLAEEIPGQPLGEDDLSDMTMEKDASLDLGLGDEEETAAPTVEKRTEPEPLEVGEDEPAEIPDNFRWFTMHEIKQLLKYENTVNLHVRSIISPL